MANRVIREGYIDSEKINSIDYQCRDFFIRLMLVADDFGYFEADPIILRPKLFPREVDKIKPETIEGMLDSCEKVDLVELYKIDKKPYGQILNFKQILRIMRSKYPTQNGQHTDKNSVQQSIPTGGPEQWLNDLPNSTHIQDISSRINVPVDQLKELLPAFKKAMEITYPTHGKFLFHFKNWAAKKLEDKSSTTKTTVTFGKNKK